MKWKTADLGSICRLINGKAFKPSDWTEEGEPIIRIQNLNDRDKPFNYWNGSLDKEVLVKPGDLLFAWSGTPGTSFGAHIWDGPSGVLNQHIFRVDLDEAVVDKKWWAGAVNFQLSELIGQAHGGVGLKHVTKGMVDRLEIPLPPLEEQKRIAAILDQADALRRLRARALDRLNTLGQAIFHEMFGDPRTNPMGWPIRPLAEIGELERGVSKHRPRNEPALLGGDHALIQTGDVSRAGDYILGFSSTYSNLGLRQSRKWPKGTLCITIAANIADTAILNFDACFPDSVVGFNSGDEATNFFVHRWFATVKSHLEQIAPAVAQKNINLAILRELPIIKPDHDLITKFFIRETALRTQGRVAAVVEIGRRRNLRVT